MTVQAQVARLACELTHKIIIWQQAHAPDWALAPFHPATAAELAQVETQIDSMLDPAHAAMLPVANGDLYIGEYVLLSTQQVVSTWPVCKALLEDGTFACLEPHYQSGGVLKLGWWHPGLIPVIARFPITDAQAGLFFASAVAKGMGWSANEHAVEHDETGGCQRLTRGSMRRRCTAAPERACSQGDTWAAVQCWKNGAAGFGLAIE